MVQRTDQTQEISVLIGYIQPAQIHRHIQHVSHILKSREIHQGFQH